MPACAAPAPPNPPVRPIRGGPLDALRFVAALFVVVFHFGDSAPVPLQSFHPVLARGYLATDFFLILSGFVIARAYGPGVVSGAVSFGRFWSRRFLRCYPTHLTTLALLVLMVGLGGLFGYHAVDGGRFDLAGLPAQILLLHSIGLGVGQWNIPSWTISTLLICYAAFPALWRAMLRVSSPAAALSLGLLVLLGADLISVLVLHAEQFSLGLRWTLLRAAPLFLVGLTLARAVQTASFGSTSARALGFSGAAFLLANALIVGPDMISVLAICTVILGCGSAPVVRPLPGAAWGARVSFSLFMVHTLTGALWFDAMTPAVAALWPSAPVAAGWLMWLAGLGLTVAVAAVYCRFVDEPMVAWLNARVIERRAAFRPRPDRYPAPERNG